MRETIWPTLRVKGIKQIWLEEVCNFFGYYLHIFSCQRSKRDPCITPKVFFATEIEFNLFSGGIKRAGLVTKRTLKIGRPGYRITKQRYEMNNKQLTNLLGTQKQAKEAYYFS